MTRARKTGSLLPIRCRPKCEAAAMCPYWDSHALAASKSQLGRASSYKRNQEAHRWQSCVPNRPLPPCCHDPRTVWASYFICTKGSATLASSAISLVVFSNPHEGCPPSSIPIQSPGFVPKPEVRGVAQFRVFQQAHFRRYARDQDLRLDKGANARDRLRSEELRAPRCRTLETCYLRHQIGKDRGRHRRPDAMLH